MSDLTEFLLARIAEDKVLHGRSMHDLAEVQGRQGSIAAAHFLEAESARVLAECHAKRRIVDQYTSSAAASGGETYFAGWSTAMDYAIRALAAVYSDHPDYDPAWRP